MSRESVADRIRKYLPSERILLGVKPNIVDFERRDEQRQSRPGGDFALVMYEDRLTIVPAWHPLNQTSFATNSAVYATASMETLSFEPVLAGKPGEVNEANIVLLGPRMDRLYDRALPARAIELPFGREVLAQGITDLMAVLGEDVLSGPGIGSIRVTVGPKAGKFGKSAIDQPVGLSVEAYQTKPSFPDRPLVVTAGPDQRFTPFLGKHAFHYGDGGRMGNIAKELGGDDAIFFAPFMAENQNEVEVLSRYSGNPKELKQAMMRLALANGLGAELMAVKKEGTVLLPPMYVNRLGGVTANYIMRYLAPELDIQAKIAPFNLEQVENGDIAGLFFAGNAARIAEIGTVRLHESDNNILRDVQLEGSPVVRTLKDRFEKEVVGAMPTTDPSLVTPVDLETGRKMRRVLEEEFTYWF